MHPLFRFSGPFRWLVLSFCLFGCGLAASAQTTTFTGTVYSPLGAPPAGTGDPIPNILVFVVAPGYPPPTFTQGLTVPVPPQTGCEAQPDLVPKLVLGQAITDPAGHFSFITTGPLPADVTVVIQAGKWRRQYHNVPVTAGGTTAPLLLAMPASHGTLADGSVADLPHIAVVTGSADSVECIFQQIGINPTTEITDPANGGSINFYQGATGPGQYISTAATTPKETDLVGVPATLNTYDVVIFGCQGATKEAAATAANLQSMETYTNWGGRMFATHYGYLWLDNSAIPDFESTADWDLNAFSASNAATLYPSLIDTTYPEGVKLAQWMTNIGALYNNTPNTIALQEVRVDTSLVNNPPAQSWVTLNHSSVYSGTGNPSMQFTFDTPIGAAGTPAVTVSYSNVATSFLQGDLADTVNIVTTNASTTATLPGLTLTIAVPAGLTVTSLADISGGGWVCDLATLVCIHPGLAAGAIDSVGMTFSIASNAQVGQANLTASLSGGGLSSSAQCGRVLFNDYHVEQTSGNVKYPKDCSTGLTVQEKFLEYSLYNLSNFVSPNTTDTIVIHGPVTLAWPQPVAIQYGTVLSAMQLDAAATDPESNATVPGAFVYTPAVGTVLAANSTCPNLSVAFTPTDATDYNSATATACLEVALDATTTTLTNPNPSIYYGQVIAGSSVGGVVSNGPGTVDGGNLVFSIDGAPSCTLQATVGGGCPPPSGVGYNAGTYTIQTKYSGDSNFLASSSALETVIVNPDPTTTTLTSPMATAPPGQSITFNASVADTYYNPVSGTMAFYDGTNLIASVPVTAQNTATYSSSNLTIGVHSIKACFVSAINSSNTYNFANTCSTPISELIQLPATVSATTTVLASSLNPSVFAQSVTFTATAATTGAFISEATGTINFYDGPTLIGSGTLTNGTTTFTTAALAVGLHSITAGYIGSATMAPSTSVVVPQQVNTSLASAESGFIMSVSPTTFSIAPGAYTSVAVSILELNNFNTPVTLTCEGLPSEATCTFGTATIPATGGGTPVTVGITAPHGCGTNSPYSAQNERRGFPILAFITFLFFARRRRALKGLVLAAMLCIIPAISGCSNCTDLGVRPGAYTFTIKATANSATPVTVAVPGEAVSGTTVTQTQTMTMNVTP